MHGLLLQCWTSSRNKQNQMFQKKGGFLATTENLPLFWRSNHYGSYCINTLANLNSQKVARIRTLGSLKWIKFGWRWWRGMVPISIVISRLQFLAHNCYKLRLFRVEGPLQYACAADYWAPQWWKCLLDNREGWIFRVVVGVWEKKCLKTIT